jgi:hypothetical protein
MTTKKNKTMIEIPKKMQCAYWNGHGDFDQLEFRTDIPVPTPVPNEELIKVGTAANNTFSLYYSKPNEINRQNYKDIRYYEIKPKDFTGDFELLVMFTKLLTIQIQLVNELLEN